MAHKTADRLQIDAALENLDVVLEFIGHYLDETNCSVKYISQIQICAEEIFVNIANYAYDGLPGPAEICVETCDQPNSITITFIDSGKPYDPLAKPDPDVTLSASDRKIGGLGIYIVKKIMDETEYKYENGRNIFRLTKLL